LFLIFNTIKFLKPIQIYYRGLYFIKNKFRKLIGFRYNFFKNSISYRLKLDNSIESKSIYSNGGFTFLNLTKKFQDKIDWNFNSHGKLWCYNLTYFDFLSKKEDIVLIDDFIKNIELIENGLEPFPISLRAVNWIKFLTKYSIRSKKIDGTLYAQYNILINNLEYHLLGNHLLENGFSLLFGAYYFRDNRFYLKSKAILLEQLEEQILDDGGHFELSPMYHQIMLFRVLDSINLIQNNSWQNKELLNFLIKKAEIMLGWLDAVSYKDGEIPMFNDSARDIAPTTTQLMKYAERLNIGFKRVKLSDSGYRKISNKNYELIIDIGDIKADYIAGHTHADIFNFELRIAGKPFIVDRGVTTYESSKIREIERSTAGHNSVEIEGKNQSEVWSSFRVGNRARVINIQESNGIIKATHNGYGNILHTRTWIFDKNSISIQDKLSKEIVGIARLYFHYTLSKSDIVKHIQIDRNSRWRFLKYQYGIGFNKRVEANYIKIYFHQNSNLIISSQAT